MAVPGPTARLRFREMTPADQAPMETLLGDPAVMWVYPRPYDPVGVRGWIDWNVRLYREHGFGLWLLELRETGEFIGECGLTPQVVEGVTDEPIPVYEVRVEGDEVRVEAAGDGR